MLSKVLPFLAFIGSVVGVFNPYEYGPLSVKQKSYFSIFNSELDHNLAVWAPEKEGKYPVIWFNSGLAGKIVF